MSSHDYPRLELLKQQAAEIGLSRDQVREFGSLARRATWESAIAFRRHVNELDQWKELENVDNVIHSEPHSTRLSSFLNFPQLLALILAVAGFFVLIVPILGRGSFPQIPQIKITIQIGTK